MPKNKTLYCLSTTAILLFLLSCSKDQKSNQQFIIPTYSQVSVTNAAVGIGSLNFYVDNQQIQLSDSLSFGTTSSFNLLNNANPSNPLSGITPYASIAYGYRDLGFSASSVNNFLASFKDYFEPGAFYSVFVADTLEYGQLQCVVLKDNLIQLDSGKAQIRFINLSPDAPSMDLWAFPNAQSSAGFKLFSNRPFPVYDYNAVLGSQNFATINSGPYYFAATQYGTLNVLLQGGLFIPNKGVVTIYSKGLMAGTGDQALDVGVIEYTR
jgi:hypothetical protein